jgi:hypothetical protein
MHFPCSLFRTTTCSIVRHIDTYTHEKKKNKMYCQNKTKEKENSQQ